MVQRNIKNKKLFSAYTRAIFDCVVRKPTAVIPSSIADSPKSIEIDGDIHPGKKIVQAPEVIHRFIATALFRIWSGADHTHHATSTNDRKVYKIIKNW